MKQHERSSSSSQGAQHAKPCPPWRTERKHHEQMEMYNNALLGDENASNNTEHKQGETVGHN